MLNLQQRRNVVQLCVSSFSRINAYSRVHVISRSFLRHHTSANKPPLHALPIPAACGCRTAILRRLVVPRGIRAVAAWLVPAAGRWRDCDCHVAASRIGGVSCGYDFGDVIRGIDRRLMRWLDRTGWRSAAGRHRFVAGCGFGAGDRGVVAGLEDDAGDYRARERFCGVFGIGDATSGGGEGRSGKCLGLTFGYRRQGAGSCGHECWSWARDEGSVDDGVIEAGSGQEACVSRAW